jgi:YD repeat-containing protein
MVHSSALNRRKHYDNPPAWQRPHNAAYPRRAPDLPAQGSPLARELFAFDPAGNLLDSLPGKDGQPVDSTLGVVGDNRLRFYQDLHFEYDVHGNVTRRTRGNQKAGAQEVLDLTWNADHQLIESNTTRHGVTQATRYAYDPLGRRVSKSDAFGSTTTCGMAISWCTANAVQGRRSISTSREVVCRWLPFRVRARNRAPTGTSATRSARRWS